MDSCSHLKNMTHREKLSILKENRSCFGCLKFGHVSKDCRNPLICDVCSQRHPTLFHIETKGKPSLLPVKNALTTLQACGQTGAGNEECVLSIIPVQVKAKSGSMIVNTYAFLDPGSSASFCTEHLMRKLNLTGTRSSILLCTLGQERSVDMLSGLQISSLDGQSFVDLPELYTQESMPVSKNNILTQDDLKDNPYLESIRIPSINAEVELLIGVNASNLMEPWEIINSQGKGPYAVKTLLGWVVNGPLRGGSSDKGKTGCPVVTANGISVARLEDLLIAQYNHDFNERLSNDDVTMSRNDQQFMEIMENTIKFEEGHYCIDLLFKSPDVIPNNRSVAEQRVLCLQRKFKSHREYQQEYTFPSFLSEAIDKGYAEMVPPHQLEREDGKVWYIPHHGVYHPKKKTLKSSIRLWCSL